MSQPALKPSPMPERFTKESKSTKSGSFARRAIGFLPAVAGTGLMLANAANAAGFIQNPALKAALKGANIVKTVTPAVQGAVRAVGQAHSLRSKSMGY